jgi:hypothetical protein
VEQIYAMLGAKFLQNLEKEAKGNNRATAASICACPLL